MRNGIWIVFAGLAALVFASFFYRTPTPPQAAQPTATFGGVSLTLELATTGAAHEKGLSGRSAVPEGSGMLFVFEKSDKYGIWMKDMLVPIDIFWLDEEGKVVSFISDADPTSYPNVFYPTAPARYVLETAAGFARAHDIATGSSLLLQNVRAVSN